MSKFIVHARYWNDEDWLLSSLRHIDAWRPNVVVIGEGNWDPTWKARSTDATRQMIEAYSQNRKNVIVIDNDRTDKNYRKNQARTSQIAMERARWKPGDWMLIIDCDQFYFRSDIDHVREMIRKQGNDFDYIVHYNRCFLYDLQHCQIKVDNLGTKLPYKLVQNCHWVATNHLAIRGKLYRKITRLRPRHLDVYGMHYEGMRNKKRLKEKYDIGDRKTFWEHDGGSRVKALQPYSGDHPLIPMDDLRRMGYA